MVVAGGRLDLEHAVADLEHGHVERAAAEVEDEDRLVGLLVEPVCQRGRCRLVDDALDVEAGDLAGVLRRLALVVVEVRGDGDHGRVDGLAEIRFRVRLQLLQDHRRDLRRRVLLIARFHASVAVGAGDDLVGDDRLLLAHLGLLAAHEALDREDRVLGVGDRLALGDSAYEALAGRRERDDGRASCARPRRSRSPSARHPRARPCTSWSCPGRCLWSWPCVDAPSHVRYKSESECGRFPDGFQGGKRPANGPEATPRPVTALDEGSAIDPVSSSLTRRPQTPRPGVIREELVSPSQPRVTRGAHGVDEGR